MQVDRHYDVARNALCPSGHDTDFRIITVAESVNFSYTVPAGLLLRNHSTVTVLAPK